MRLSKILALGLMAACAIASSANAGSRDRNPNNGDELIGYADGGNGGSAEIMTGMASIAANMLGVRIPGVSSQSAPRYQPQYQPQYQEYGGYQRDPGAPAYDLYADCRYGRGQIDGHCVRTVNAKLSQAARASGEAFICKDRYGRLVRTQNYSYGCRLESKMTNF